MRSFRLTDSNLAVFTLSLASCCAIQYQQKFLLYDKLSSFLIFGATVLLILSMAIAYHRGVVKRSEFTFLIIICFVLCVPVFLNSVYYIDRIPVGVILGSVFSGYQILIAKSNSKYADWLLLIPFYLYSFFIIISLINNPNPNEVFLNSKNWISYFLIMLIFPYYARKFLLGSTTYYTPVIVLLLLSFFSLGRSGIISALLVMVAVMKYKNNSKFMLWIQAVLGAMFIIYLFAHFKDYIFSIELSAANRFSINGFFNDARSTIFSEYIQSISVENMLVGFENRELYFSIISSTNPHNSFLKALIGGGLPFLVILVIFTIASFWVSRSNAPLQLIILACVLRASTDAGSLITYFDSFVFLGVLIWFGNRKRTLSKNCVSSLN